MLANVVHLQHIFLLLKERYKTCLLKQNALLSMHSNDPFIRRLFCQISSDLDFKEIFNVSKALCYSNTFSILDYNLKIVTTNRLKKALGY